MTYCFKFMRMLLIIVLMILSFVSTTIYYSMLLSISALLLAALLGRSRLEKSTMIVSLDIIFKEICLCVMTLFILSFINDYVISIADINHYGINVINTSDRASLMALSISAWSLIKDMNSEKIEAKDSTI